MRELALHLLDIAHNSVSAKAKNITISVEEDSKTDRLKMAVSDDGMGMDAFTVQRVTDPFVTSRTTRNVGLGIPLLKAAAESCDGYLNIHSTVGIGTSLEVEFQHSHIDRMPLGNLSETFLSLLVGCPEIHWMFYYRVDENAFEFDDEFVKQELKGIPLCEPEILAYLREMIESGITAVQSAYQAST